MKTIAINICSYIQVKGFQAVFAGGCVRDKLLGIEPHDYDIATDANPQQIIEIFSTSKMKKYYKINEVGKNFGVILLTHKKDSSLQYEIATFRNDGDYSDNRRPDFIEFCSMEEDAKRRDFTINGMFYDPIADKLYDFVGGREDLEEGIIRFVGNATERINEDSLRILRAIRFAVKYDFYLAKSIILTLLNYSSTLKTLAKERIQQEFNKILELQKPYLAIKVLLASNTMKYIIPEITTYKGCIQGKNHHPEGDVLEHTLLFMEALVEQGQTSYQMQLAGLLHDVGKLSNQVIVNEDKVSFHGHAEDGAILTEDILKRLKYSNEDIEMITFLVRNHMRILSVREMKKSKLKKLFAEPYINELIEIYKADNASSAGDKDDQIQYVYDKMEEFAKEPDKPLQLEPNIIDGNDLISIGLKPSPLFREILDKIYDMYLNDEIRTKEQAIKFVQLNYPVIKDDKE